MLACLAYYSSLPKEQRRTPPSWVLEELEILLNRTQGSVSLRFANFNSVDPDFTDLGLKGMVGGGAHVQAIWAEVSKNDGHLDLNRLLRLVAREISQTGMEESRW
ncbi:MAG: hypothetical protein RL036_25 [Actinomycetota bacterium]|jgi:hypothetical protein